ncbi:T9SS type A sorting domain-containing protein [Mesonia aquimarina]|uniref:T9SS type A sorting domain-containing protein n=1 Tax=Mesonia aquimarina TaxID=1504967 RepID=UPI0013CEB565|nr:T9SS type A sorting domain-containing protein [Mesonia aquimarina]
MKNNTTNFFTLIFLSFTTFVFAQTWQSKTGLGNNTRHHPVTWALNGYGYAATGTNVNNNPTKDFNKYDPTTDSWETLSDFPGPARSFSIGGVYNGEAYLGFGAGTSNDLNDLWKYNPTTETWEELSSCPCTGRKHPTFTINDQYGKIYVGKGNNASGNLDDWWEYDIATDTWTQLIDFPGTARHHPYHFSIGNYSYTGLGHDGSPQMARDDWYRFDPSDNSWDQMATAPGARIAGTQFSHNGKGFVLSGDAENHDATNPSIFWMYDPATDSWTVLNPHPGNSIWAPGSFIINDTLYFFGGVDFIGQTFQTGMWTTDLNNLLNNNSFEKNAITLYPNPAKNSITLSTKEQLKNPTINIYSLDGRLIKEINYTENIDISSINSGVYILEITDDKQTSTIKFVKE